MGTKSGRRVFRLRLHVAVLVGALAGAVAGPVFEVLVAGWLGVGLLVFAAVIGGIVSGVAGLAAAGLVNLALRRTEGGLAPSTVVVALWALALLGVIAAYIAFGGLPTDPIGFRITVIAALVGIPAAVATVYRSSENAG